MAERYARFAISILDDRLASPINDYDNAKDVQFLTETYDDATNTLESIAKIVRCCECAARSGQDGVPVEGNIVTDCCSFQRLLN